jgi:lipopolysaccharide/colanic/teichoic acid biosynthesis glycosyltransferase
MDIEISSHALPAAKLRETVLNDARPSSGWYSLCETVLETVAAGVLLVLTAPVLLAVMVLVKLTSRGPALYTQTRVGRDGRVFTLYKIRSMTHDCERLTGPQWATANDPRLTAVGRVLRRIHVDELPQLWNVVRGEMSLIGPRPERPEFVRQLERALPGYRGRLAVRPGITGLAQIQLAPDVDLNGVRRKLVCDLYYVDRVSALLDLQILLATATKIAGLPFGVSKTLWRVPDLAAIEDSHRHRIAAASQVQPAY